MSRAVARLGPERHRIAELVFALDIGARCSSLQGPEDLTAAIRRELLPAIESALRSVEATGHDLMLDRIELDLGETPDEPDWPALRRHLHESLVSALMARIDPAVSADVTAHPRPEAVASPTGLRRVADARPIPPAQGVRPDPWAEDESVDQPQAASGVASQQTARPDLHNPVAHDQTEATRRGVDDAEGAGADHIVPEARAAVRATHHGSETAGPRGDVDSGPDAEPATRGGSDAPLASREGDARFGGGDEAPLSTPSPETWRATDGSTTGTDETGPSHEMGRNTAQTRSEPMVPPDDSGADDRPDAQVRSRPDAATAMDADAGKGATGERRDQPRRADRALGPAADDAPGRPSDKTPAASTDHAPISHRAGSGAGEQPAAGTGAPAKDPGGTEASPERDAATGLAAGAGGHGQPLVGDAPVDLGRAHRDADQADAIGTSDGGVDRVGDPDEIGERVSLDEPGAGPRAATVAPASPAWTDVASRHRDAAGVLPPTPDAAADGGSGEADVGMRAPRTLDGGADGSGDADDNGEGRGLDEPGADEGAMPALPSELRTGGQRPAPADALDERAVGARESMGRSGDGDAARATPDRIAIEAVLAGWDRAELLRLGAALLAARGGDDMGATMELAALTVPAAEHDGFPARVAELLRTAGDGSARPGGDLAAVADAAGPASVGSIPGAAAENSGDDAARDPVEGPSADAGLRRASPGASRRPEEKAAAPAQLTLPSVADPALMTRLSGRLAEATPFAALGLQEALGLFWSALPATITADARAGGIFLGATARIAGAGRADLAALRRAIHDLLAIAATEADRRLAARTALTRMRYAAPGSPRARSLALAALDAVMPGLDTTSPDTAMGLVTGVGGLVLFAPYLRMLFDRGGVLDGAALIPADRLPRAHALLAGLSGREVVQPDPLERVLLGLPPGQPIDLLPLDDELRTLTDGLVRAVIAQWGALGKTSPDGLREAFIRRDGDLILETEGVARLRVLPGPFDMLLDRLPWSIALIRTPWMPGPLHVRWRGHDDS